MAGKGSRQRPVDRDKFASNWDRIFGKKEADFSAGSTRALEGGPLEVSRESMDRLLDDLEPQQPESKPQPASVPVKGGKGNQRAHNEH